MAKRGPLYVLICYVLWGILPIFWKLLGALDAFYVLASRILWSLLLAAVVLTVQRKLGTVRAVFHNRRELGRLTAAAAAITVNWGVFIWAVNNGHMLDSSLAYYMNPLLSILLGTLVYRERLTRVQWLAVAVTLTGIVVTVLRYGQIPWIALVIGGSFAVYGAVKKSVRTEAVTALLFETLIPAPLALAAVFWMERRSAGAVGTLHGWQWLLLPAAGIVTTIPLLFFAVGIRHTSMSLSGILMYANPTLQLLLSVWLYGETFTATHAILFGFVWTGLALYLYAARRKNGIHEKEKSPCA